MSSDYNPVLDGPDEGGRSLLRDRAYQELKQLLVMDPAPPAPFLSERKLAKHLGISNTPVRSAIERLEVEGFITISPNQGIVVREPTVEEVRDHYELRQALEPYVLRRVAGTLRPEQEARVRANLEAQQRLTAEGATGPLTRLDSEFHLLFCEFLGNEAIVRTMLQLRDRIHRVILRLSRQVPGRLAASHREHEEIAGAVIRGDGEAAAALVVAHLENGRRHFVGGGTP